MKIIKVIAITSILTLLFCGSLFAESLRRTLDDGATINIHYDPGMLENVGVSPDYPVEILNAASKVYTILTSEFGFDRKGYTLVSPDRSYTYDPDESIDIYLGDADSKEQLCGFKPENFRTSYFATCGYKDKENVHDVIILFPCRIGVLREKGQTTSSRDSDETLILGTLIHEMTHIMTYQYCRNLETVSDLRDVDWFVEGLARYMETKIGSFNGYYSRGYTRDIPGGYAYLAEGINYFMKHPGRPLDELSYDFSVFWNYFDDKYGFEKIEAFCGELRALEGDDFMPGLEVIFEKTTGAAMEETLRDFAYYLYKISLHPKRPDKKVDEMLHSKAYFNGKRFLRLDGTKVKRCDVYEEDDMHPWMTGFHKMKFADGQTTPLRFVNTGEAEIMVQVMTLVGDDEISRRYRVIKKGESCELNELTGNQTEEAFFYFAVTNLDPCKKASFKITPPEISVRTSC